MTQCDRCILNFLHPLPMQEVGNGLGCSQIQQLLTLFLFRQSRQKNNKIRPMNSPNTLSDLVY